MSEGCRQAGRRASLSMSGFSPESYSSASLSFSNCEAVPAASQPELNPDMQSSALPLLLVTFSRPPSTLFPLLKSTCFHSHSTRNSCFQEVLNIGHLEEPVGSFHPPSTGPLHLSSSRGWIAGAPAPLSCWRPQGRPLMSLPSPPAARPTRDGGGSGPLLRVKVSVIGSCPLHTASERAVTVLRPLLRPLVGLV